VAARAFQALPGALAFQELQAMGAGPVRERGAVRRVPAMAVPRVLAMAVRRVLAMAVLRAPPGAALQTRAARAPMQVVAPPAAAYQ
jgi:hypothetical protein